MIWKYNEENEQLFQFDIHRTATWYLEKQLKRLTDIAKRNKRKIIDFKEIMKTHKYSGCHIKIKKDECRLDTYNPDDLEFL